MTIQNKDIAERSFTIKLRTFWAIISGLALAIFTMASGYLGTMHTLDTMDAEHKARLDFLLYRIEQLEKKHPPPKTEQ